MDVESSTAHEVSVDWRGRPCEPGRHGGMRAAVFVLGIQAFEIMAIAAVGNNLITYVFGEMHFPLSEAANVVTNFVGTIFLLSLLGGFLSDSYLGCFWTMLTFGFVELSGFILLSVQAHLPQLKPPPCNMASMDGSCEQARGFKSSIFFVALYLVALGSGCLKPNMIAHGGDQFSSSGGSDNAKSLSTYFNFACTIVFNTVLAQLQTFSVQQGSAMDTVLGGAFRVPPASLQAIPYAMLLLLVPAYELLLVPFMKRLTGTRSGITPLQRIGVGLGTVAFSMVAAATVERRRRDLSASGARMSVLWIVPQFLVFGVSEMFTAVGLIEFFYKQACAGMQSFLTALTYCSYAFGFYLSSVLVTTVNRVTARHGGAGWLGDNDLNKDRLDLFYWMLAALSVLNFFCYLVCARWYNSGADGSDAASAQIAAEGDAKEIS
ncbi:unnamed protein product [Triticum turgidum subsp. durum]|uniref:Uncharacterized protein n=1 Tax=Triticum turgidum subsp. durum TaxID=4567 RepID=A0A9R1PQW5_TRITD|nr:unnamed protein product [Triticum turgidum subsp. durum]